MPERITITNYSSGPVAHIGTLAVLPGETRSRPVRSYDLDLSRETWVRAAAMGLAIKFDAEALPGLVEASAALTVAPSQRLVVATSAGFSVALPKLSEVPQDYTLTIIRKAGPGTLTVEADGDETISGQPGAELTEDGQKLRLRPVSATNWGTY